VAVTILLVDNEAEFLALARAILEDRPGLSVIGQAASGEEALALLPALDPDVAVVDVQLPGLNGFETARRMAEVSPRLGVILTSAVDLPLYADLARDVGAAFVAKKNLSVTAVLDALAPAPPRVSVGRPPADSAGRADKAPTA